MIDSRLSGDARGPRTLRPRCPIALPFVLLFGAIGCAASPGAGTAAAPARPAMVFNDPSVATLYSEVPRAAERRLAQSPAVVLAAARQLLATYEIPLTLDQPASGQVGNPNFYRSRRLLGRSMVDLFNCGSTITGPNAASYRIFLSMVLTVKAVPAGGSTAALVLTASAQDLVGGSSSDRLPCGSTGTAEELFLTALQQQAGKSAAPEGKAEGTTVLR